MTRILITEGLIDKVIMAFFNAVLKDKRRALAKAAAADPEIKQILLDLEKAKANLRRVLEKHAQDQDINPLLTGLD